MEKSFPSLILQKSFVFALLFISLFLIYILSSYNSTTVDAALDTGLPGSCLLKNISITALGLVIFWYFCFILNKFQLQRENSKKQQKTIHEKENEIQQQKVIINDFKKAIIDYECRALAGTYASSIAHDINNLLTIIYYDITELMETKDSYQGKVEQLQNLELTFKKVEQSAKSLNEISKRQIDCKLVRFDIGNLLKETIDLSKKHMKLRSCSIRFNEFPVTYIESNPLIIGQSLLNLLLNAADSNNQTGVIDVKMIELLDYIRIEIHDSGKVIYHGDSEKNLDSYIAAKANGSRVNLAGVKIGMELLKSKIEVGNSYLGGTVFILEIPKRKI